MKRMSHIEKTEAELANYTDRFLSPLVAETEASKSKREKREAREGIMSKTGP